MKKATFILCILLTTNAWSVEKGLECVRYSRILGEIYTFYYDFIINVDEKYILAYPGYGGSDASSISDPGKYPPETSFTRHQLELTPEHIKWAIKDDGNVINHKLYRKGLGLIQQHPSFSYELECETMGKGKILENIYSRAIDTL